MLPETILSNSDVQAALRQAWQDSNPGLTGGHETGGFIVQTAQGDLRVIRWPEGGLDAVWITPHDGCKVEGEDIVATFHTHPDTGTGYEQEPSDVDRNNIRNDVNLKSADYIGEFVISARDIFLIAPTGDVTVVAYTNYVLWILP